VARNRILFVVPALRRAGAESQLLTLVNGLQSEKFEKHVVSYLPGDDLVSDFCSDVHVHECFRRRKFDPGVGRDIAHIIDQHEIDIVHCTLLNALMYGLLGKMFARRKPPIVSVIHTTKNVDSKHELAEKFVYRPLLKCASQIWFVSTLQAALWIEKMPFIGTKCRTIHNGVDTDYFSPGRFIDAGVSLREQLGIAPEASVICCVAGLRPEKLHSVLISAIGIVRNRRVPCKLLIAGEGSMERPLRTLVEDLDLEDDVYFLGALSDVRPLLAASDCKVLASAAETFSIAMLESMAMGVPVISTEVGGASEAIEDGISGALVPAGDVTALADRIVEILDGKALRFKMGALARETVIRDFRTESMVTRSAACLQEVLAN